MQKPRGKCQSARQPSGAAISGRDTRALRAEAAGCPGRAARRHLNGARRAGSLKQTHGRFDTYVITKMRYLMAHYLLGGLLILFDEFIW